MASVQETACQALALRLMARLLSYPDEKLGECVSALRGLFEEGSPERELLHRMMVELEGSDPLTLRIDYTALFIGAFEMLAAPYASYYLDGERQLGGPTTVAVERCYRECGMALSSGPKRPGDHVATMLEFASALLERSLEGSAGGLERERERESQVARASWFCRTYVEGWMPEFSRLTVRHAKTGFYRAVGELAGMTLACGALLPDE